MISSKIYYDYRDIRRRHCALTNGCFDVLHIGHLRLLEEAKILTDDTPLIVAVNDDDSVRLLKGDGRPVNSLMDRMGLLAGLICVDCLVGFGGRNMAHIIRELSPLYWIKGSPYTRETLDREEVAAADEVGAKIMIVEKFGDYSTTELVRRMKG